MAWIVLHVTKIVSLDAPFNSKHMKYIKAIYKHSTCHLIIKIIQRISLTTFIKYVTLPLLSTQNVPVQKPQLIRVLQGE